VILERLPSLELLGRRACLMISEDDVRFGSRFGSVRPRRTIKPRTSKSVRRVVVLDSFIVNPESKEKRVFGVDFRKFGGSWLGANLFCMSLRHIRRNVFTLVIRPFIIICKAWIRMIWF